MRLRRLQLRHYGCFKATDLELAVEPGRITMVVAPNGAGKSVLRRAFHDLLFDIPMQSPMKFRHGYSGMALHAEVVDADGTAFDFGWVRGGKPPRLTTDPVRFAALQRGVTPHQLERLFALDTAGLRSGGTDLKGGTTLAGALLAGTGELTPAKSVRAIIEARRQANWGQGKSKPPLNASASALEGARKKARAAVQRPEKRDKEERDLEERRQEHSAAKQERDNALTEVSRLNRIALTRPHLQQSREAEEWFASHPDTPALPGGLDQQLADTRSAVATAQATHDGAQQALALASEAADQIDRDPVANHLAEQLSKLPGMLGEVEKTAKDIVDRRAEHAAKLDDVRSALRDIGTPVPEQEAGELIPTIGLMAEARAAITKEAGLRKALELAVEGVAKAKAVQATAEAEPASASVLPDGLMALLDEIRADRSPIQHAAEVAETARAAAIDVTRTLALVPGWAGTAEAMRALVLPSEAAFQRLDDARQAASSRAKESHGHRIDLAAQEAAARVSLSALRERPLPDAASVAAARIERDHGMRLVLRRAFAMHPTAAEENAYAGDEPVALVYERQVRQADELADRRTAELERVQEAERLTRLITEMVGPLLEANAAEVEAILELTATEQAWTNAVTQLGLNSAATMTELRDALTGRLKLIEAISKAEVASGTETALKAMHQEWAIRLAALLGMPPEPLQGLLNRADDHVAAVRAAETSAARRQAKIEAAKRTLQESKDAQVKAEDGLQVWGRGWAELLERLHRPAGESSDAVAAVLSGLTILDQHHRGAVSLEQRIIAMQADLDRFAMDVADLACGLGEPAVTTTAATARALIARAAVAADAESAWKQAQLSLEQAQIAASEGQVGLAKAEAQLTAVVAACGAMTPEDAEGRIAASRAYTEQITRRAEARKGLTEHGDGFSDAILQAEADAVSMESMAASRRDAADALEAAGTKVESAAVKLDQLKTVLDIDADATIAIDARADYEAAAAEFGRRLEDQLVLNLASTMLTEAMRSVEEDIGGSSLDRVSKAFAAVTDGAYGLDIQDGAGGEELYAIEHAYPNEHKTLDDLSEGTRDQLYLALRMVALRDHCASATALPFLADDILQTFDDGRARATLQALCELSNELQVIVLTHHAHLGSVAAALGDERVRLVHL